MEESVRAHMGEERVMTYTLFYTSEDVEPTPTGPRPMGTWSVYSEVYADIADKEPIEGSTVHVSGNHMSLGSAQAESDDTRAARDFFITCQVCSERIVEVEDNDTLRVLFNTVLAHTCYQ